MTAQRPRAGLMRLVGWVLAANASALAVAAALAGPAGAPSQAARSAVRGFMAWCGIG